MLKLALRNIFRHRLRTALTLAAIVAGVAGLILSGGFVADSLRQLREATIHSQLGHLQIYRRGYFEHGLQAPNRYLLDKPDALVRDIAALPQVEDAMVRLSFSGVINNGRTDIAIVGVGLEPEKEARLGSAIAMTAGRRLHRDDTYTMLLGEGVARATRLKTGDRATVLVTTPEGALNTLELEIAGIFRSFSKDYDAHAVLVPLAAAQQLLDVQGGNAVVVALKSTDSTRAVEALLRQRLDDKTYEIKRWDELADFYAKTAALYERQFDVLQIIILIAVLLSVVNSVNMSTFERTGELGTLMALGTTRGSVFKLVITENALLGLLGAATGAALGLLLAWALSAIGIPMPPPPNSNVGYTAAIRVEAWLVAIACAIGMTATVAAAIVPALRVARLPVVEALRHYQ